MKALVKSVPGPGLSLQEVPKPNVGENDILIKIHTTGICGTDLYIYDWNYWAEKTIPVPITIGHEFVGEIAAVGKSVSHFNIGERVSGEGHITCNICRFCRSPKHHLCPNAKGIGIHKDGTFAEYLTLPAQNVIKLPASIPNDIAAILDPLGNAVHTTHAADVVGEDVLITGAGPIGLMTVALLKHLGAHHIVVTDINPYRLNLAKTLGATHTINVKETSLEDALKNITLANGFTVGFEMSGKEDAVQTHIKKLAPGSVLAALGIPAKPITVDWNAIIFKGLKLKGIYGREMYETWTKMIALLESGLDLAPLITHHYHFSEYVAAFEKAKSGQAGKVLIHWE